MRLVVRAGELEPDHVVGRQAGRRLVIWVSGGVVSGPSTISHSYSVGRRFGSGCPLGPTAWTLNLWLSGLELGEGLGRLAVLEGHAVDRALDERVGPVRLELERGAVALADERRSLRDHHDRRRVEARRDHEDAELLDLRRADPSGVRIVGGRQVGPLAAIPVEDPGQAALGKGHRVVGQAELDRVAEVGRGVDLVVAAAGAGRSRRAAPGRRRACRARCGRRRRPRRRSARRGPPKPGTCRSTDTFIPTGVLGSVRSIVQKYVSGVWSTLPARSTARTWSEWSPGEAAPRYSAGDSQPSKPSQSSEHSKVAVGSSDANAK